MKHFKINELGKWRNSGNGEVIEAPAPNGFRTVKLSVNADQPVSIYMKDTSTPDPILIGHSDGLFVVEATAQGDSELIIHCDDEAIVFIKPHTPDLKVNAQEKDVYTSVEPMRKQRTETDQVRYMFARNEQRRNALLEEERQALRKERQQARKEREEDQAVRKEEREARKARKAAKEKANETSTTSNTAATSDE